VKMVGAATKVAREERKRSLNFGTSQNHHIYLELVAPDLLSGGSEFLISGGNHELFLG